MISYNMDLGVALLDAWDATGCLRMAALVNFFFTSVIICRRLVKFEIFLSSRGITELKI